MCLVLQGLMQSRYELAQMEFGLAGDGSPPVRCTVDCCLAASNHSEVEFVSTAHEG